MRPLHSTAGLVRRAVLFRDIRLGTAVDALFDRELGRLTALDVLCGDGRHRLLPLPACEICPDKLAVSSALVFVEQDAGFYRTGARSFGELAGQPVRLRGARLGLLVDVLVTGEGEVERVVVEGLAGLVELERDPALAVGSLASRPAV